MGSVKRKLINRIKYSPRLYSLYYTVVNSLMKIVASFVKTDCHLILFNSYAGRKYDDSPKEIFEVMRRDERFKDYHLIWAFHNPDRVKDFPEAAEKIKTDSLHYFITAMKARVWVTNSSVERGLHFKKKNTLYFNTWHGTPIKKMGSDLSVGTASFSPKKKEAIDIMMAQGDFEAEVFSRSFDIKPEHFLKMGYPRNDILVNHTDKDRELLRKKLNIPTDKKAILYCPTFREFEKDENNGCVLIPPMNLSKWEEQLKDEYVLLFRAHYEVANVMEIQENGFVRDMTDYPSLNELMIASDLLLSDYSSVFFDYSIMDKSMLHFTYDYEKYVALRGMYFDIRDWLSGGENEESVIGIIRSLDEQKEIRKTSAFRNKYVNYYGNAAQAAVDCIAEKLEIRWI